MEFASLEPTKLVTVELFTLPSQSLTHSVTLPSRSQMPSAFLPLLHTGWTSISEFSDVQLLLVFHCAGIESESLDACAVGVVANLGRVGVGGVEPFGLAPCVRVEDSIDVGDVRDGVRVRLAADFIHVELVFAAGHFVIFDKVIVREANLDGSRFVIRVIRSLQVPNFDGFPLCLYPDEVLGCFLGLEIVQRARTYRVGAVAQEGKREKGNILEIHADRGVRSSTF